MWIELKPLTLFEALYLLLTFFAALAAVVSLIALARQARGASDSAVTAAQISADRIFVDHPHLRKYFLGGQPIPVGSADYDQALSAAQLLANFFESYFQQRHRSSQLYDEGTWLAYIKEHLCNSPILRNYLEQYQRWYTSDLVKLKRECCPEPALEGEASTEPPKCVAEQKNSKIDSPLLGSVATQRDGSCPQTINPKLEMSLPPGPTGKATADPPQGVAAEENLSVEVPSPERIDVPDEGSCPVAVEPDSELARTSAPTGSTSIEPIQGIEEGEDFMAEKPTKASIGASISPSESVGLPLTAPPPRT